jgi:hypothetical protein
MTQRAWGITCKRTAVNDDTSLSGALRELFKSRDITLQKQCIMTKGKI